MMKKVSIYRRWTGPAPPGVPRSKWPRRRKHVWVVRWCSPDGKMPQVTCKTKAEAERIRSEKEVEFDRVPAARNKPVKITTSAFLKEYTKIRIGPRGQRLKSGTLRQGIAALKRFAIFVGGDTALVDITTADAARFVAMLREAKAKSRGGKKLSPASVNQIIRSLKSAFGVAVRQLAYLRTSPLGLLRQDKVPDVEVRYIAVAQFHELYAAASHLPDYRALWWETFLAILYTAGLRLNEATNLTWSDIDFENDNVRVIAKPEVGDLPAWQPKSKRSRIVPVPAATVDLCTKMHELASEGNPYVLIPDDRLAYIQEAKKVCTWREGQAVLNNLGRTWRRLTATANVSSVTPHDLRRSCITNWARRLPIHTVMELAGHASMTTTQKYYLAITPADMEAARKATEDAIKTL